MKKVKLMLFVILATMLSVSIGFAAEKNFKADLTGDEEVPSVNTPAKGEAKFTLSDDGKTLSFTLVVRDIENPTAAHIHIGKIGKSGAALAILFSGPKREGKFRGNLAQASIAEKDLKGDLKGKSINTLVALIKSGEAYVNVHTDAYPGGEIRGQIK
ncbi:MAG: CHRD domain-containing protein [Desulfuromonadales bacterium]|nr:CHRD domain-containing protein [Desulfuromonadales bacterium]